MRTNDTKPGVANTNEIQKVFSRRVAHELRKKGFKIVGTEVNFRQPELDVYCFEKSDDLVRALYSIPKK